MAENKIYGILINVREITAEELEEIREVIREQFEYNQPLKPATSGRQHALAEHNQAVLDALLNLKEVIESGANI